MACDLCLVNKGMLDKYFNFCPNCGESLFDDYDDVFDDEEEVFEDDSLPKYYY